MVVVPSYDSRNCLLMRPRSAACSLSNFVSRWTSTFRIVTLALKSPPWIVRSVVMELGMASFRSCRIAFSRLLAVM